VSWSSRSGPRGMEEKKESAQKRHERETATHQHTTQDQSGVGVLAGSKLIEHVPSPPGALCRSRGIGSSGPAGGEWMDPQTLMTRRTQGRGTGLFSHDAPAQRPGGDDLHLDEMMAHGRVPSDPSSSAYVSSLSTQIRHFRLLNVGRKGRKNASKGLHTTRKSRFHSL
jgi:hypothetical protein